MMKHSLSAVRSLLAPLYNNADRRVRTFSSPHKMPVRHYYPANLNLGAASLDWSFLKKQMRKITLNGHHRSIYLFSAYLGVVGAVTYYSLQQAKKGATCPVIRSSSDKNYRHPSVHDVSSY